MNFGGAITFLLGVVIGFLFGNPGTRKWMFSQVSNRKKSSSKKNEPGERNRDVL